MPIYQDKNGVKVVEVTVVIEEVIPENVVPLHGTKDSISLPGHHYSVYHQRLDQKLLEIDFQEGPVGEVGVNGVTSEALLAIIIDRTEKLNQQFPCQENVQALSHLRDTLANFNSRTWNREVRNVEGFNLA